MSTTPDLTGKTIDKYFISAFIASGGMAAVYRASQTNLSREVAIKVLPTAMAEDPTYVARFLREAETAAKLEHPHIIPIYDYGSEKGLNYVVMRLLTGGTLTERMKARQDSEHPLPSLGEIARLLRQLAGALDHAHAMKVIHRDVKPSNIMFDAAGTPFLVDFGIAKLIATTAESLTETGVPMGTPIYMSPEQWDSLPATPAIDQYALAVVIYRLVTGDAPFRSDTPYGLMQKHLASPVPPVTNHPEPMATQLHAVLNKALAKEPTDRYLNCIAFADAFEVAIQDDTTPANGFFTFELPDHDWATAINTDAVATAAFSEQRIVTRPTNPSSRLGMVLVGLVVIAVLVIAAFVLTAGDDGNGGNGGNSENDTPAPAVINPTTTAGGGEDVDTDPPPTNTAAPIVPVAAGEDVPITLEYGNDSSTLLIANRSTQPVDITGMRLQLPGGDQYFDGARFGATTSANFLPGRCILVGLTADDPTFPTGCTPNSAKQLLNFGTAEGIYFVWDSEVTVLASFEVLLNGTKLADCELAAGSCVVNIPAARVIVPTATPRPVIAPQADEQNGVVLIYPNGSSITIINTSAQTLDLTGVQLELADGSDHFDAQWFGEQTRTTFNPGRCIFISLRSADETAPDFCGNVSPLGYDRTSQASYVFVWNAEANPDGSFNVSRDDVVLTTCSVDAGRCFVPVEQLQLPE